MKEETIGDCRLILGDCFDILPLLGKVDACITDPPYGIDFEYASHDDNYQCWQNLMTKLVKWCRANVDVAIMPSCQIKSMTWIYATIPPDWLLCWFKGSPGHRAFVGFNSWEPHLVYGKRPGTQYHDHFSARPSDQDPTNGHPCPKSIGWANYLISRATLPDDTVVDPFLGSGTVLMACAKLGRKGIGIEKDKKYFDIACRRVEEAYKQGDFFIERPKIKQESFI